MNVAHRDVPINRGDRQWPAKRRKVKVRGSEMITPNSTRVEDWARFSKALLSLIVVWPPFWAACKAVWPYLHEVLHTGKNIVVEEARRWGFEIRPSKWQWVASLKPPKPAVSDWEHSADLEAERSRQDLL